MVPAAIMVAVLGFRAVPCRCGCILWVVTGVGMLMYHPAVLMYMDMCPVARVRLGREGGSARAAEHKHQHRDEQFQAHRIEYIQRITVRRCENRTARSLLYRRHARADRGEKSKNRAGTGVSAGPCLWFRLFA